MRSLAAHVCAHASGGLLPVEGVAVLAGLEELLELVLRLALGVCAGGPEQRTAQVSFGAVDRADLARRALDCGNERELLTHCLDSSVVVSNALKIAASSVFVKVLASFTFYVLHIMLLS